jgi:hypothetical protein
VTSFASVLLPDKGIPVETMAPDLTVGCVEYDEGVVARVTCSLVAPVDKSLLVVGDEGVLCVRHVRHDAAPVYVRAIPARGWMAGLERRANALRQALHLPGWERDWHLWRRVPPVRLDNRRRVTPGRTKQVDFCRGVQEMIAAIAEKRPCRLSAELGLHVVELIERLQYPARFGEGRDVKTRFAAPAPMAVDS